MFVTFIGLSVCATARDRSVPYGYLAAECGKDGLTVFPTDKNPTTIPLPTGLVCVEFGVDGRTIYATDALKPGGLLPSTPRPRLPDQLLKIQFNPTRVDRIPGWIMLSGFGIYDYAISRSEDHIVISGRRRDGTCGLFVLDLIGGNVRQVLENSGCDWRSAWHDLSVSPSGERAVSTHNGRLELIDLVHGTSRSLGELASAAWSPDGKWIAAIKGRGKLVLIDSTSFSQRRLPGHCPFTPEWSPDSRYLLLWKYHLFRCGFSLDVEGPATLLTLEIATGKKSTIRSTECRIQGITGWVGDEIVH
jgi:hypothetical protein